MALLQRGSIWYYDFYVDGKRYAGSTGMTSKSKAQEVVDKLKLQQKTKQSLKQVWQQTKRAMGVLNEMPLQTSAVFDYYAKQRLLKCGSNHIQRYKACLNNFIRWMSDNYPSIQAMGEVTPEIATEYIYDQRQKPGAPGTRNLCLSLLKSIFTELGDKCGIIENPFANIKREKYNTVSRDVYTPEELRLIGEKATGFILDVCLTAVCTGLREGDIACLTKDCISPDFQWLHIDKIRKTGRPLDVPIMPCLREHIQDCIRMNGDTEWIYPKLHELYMNSRPSIGRKVKQFLTDIGITGVSKKVEGYAQSNSLKDVHSFRHTFVYLAACNNVPFPIVQQIVGHASPAMTKIYMDHATAQDKVKYLSTIPEYIVGDVVSPKSPIYSIIEMVERNAPKDTVLDALRKLL